MSKARDIASAAPAPAGVTSTELGYVDGVTSAIQTQINAKQAVVSGVNDTEIGYLDGVTSAIQTQLNAKQAIVSGVDDTEIGYLNGVTSAIQTQLNQKPEFAAGKNAIINGGMDIWQRGTSFTVSNNAYLMDRWVNTGNTNLTVTLDTDVPTDPYFQYSAKLVGTGTQSIAQRIESANAVRFVGKVITISLYAKKTSGTGALNINLYYPNAKDNHTAVTQIGSPLLMSSNPGSSWVRYSVTTTALPTQVQNGLVVLIDNTNTHTIFVTGVQVEAGSVATPYSMSSGTLAGELTACQRYFESFQTCATGTWGSTVIIGTMNWKVLKRSTPSLSLTTAGFVAGGGSNISVSSIGGVVVNEVGGFWDFNVSGASSSVSYAWRQGNIIVSAEL